MPCVSGRRIPILVRDSNKPEVRTLAGDRVELFDFDAVTAMTRSAKAVRGALAVVSALQGGPDVIIDAQLSLLRAAKAAGLGVSFPPTTHMTFSRCPKAST